MNLFLISVYRMKQFTKIYFYFISTKLQMKNIVSSIIRARLLKRSNCLVFGRQRVLGCFRFSTIKSDKNPNQIPQEVRKLMQSQKVKRKPQEIPVLKDITQLKSVQELPAIYKQMVFLNKESREIALRYLLSAIYQHKVPVDVLQSKTLQVNLAQYPHLKLETEIYHINHLAHQIQQINKEMTTNPNQEAAEIENKERKVLQLFNKINDMYYHSFNVTLKTILADHLIRSKATLYKHFAQYNFEHLFNPKITDKASSLYDSNLATLKKAREFLIESLKCHKQVLLSEHKKLQSDQIKALRQQDADRHDIRLNAIKQNVRKLVESIGECLYAIFKIVNKQHRLLKDPFQHRNRKIELLSLIDSYIPFYSILPGIKQLSMMYYKLYKIKIEAKYTAVGDPKTQDELKAKIKETVEDYSRLYKECQDCLEESIQIDKFQSIKEISTTILSIKFMIGKTVKKSEIDIKKSLAEQAKNIIDRMKKEYKLPIQHYLMQIIKDMLNLKS